MGVLKLAFHSSVFSTFWIASSLEIFSTLEIASSTPFSLYSLVIKRFVSSPSRLITFSFSEQILEILYARLYGIFLTMWEGWQLLGSKYWHLSIGFL